MMEPMEGDHASKPKHRTRAVQAMADHLCASDFTDGFCSPRDGQCRGGSQVTPRRNCMHVAEQCMQSIECRGVMVVWPYDKE
jgi:transposase